MQTDWGIAEPDFLVITYFILVFKCKFKFFIVILGIPICKDEPVREPC